MLNHYQEIRRRVVDQNRCVRGTAGAMNTFTMFMVPDKLQQVTWQQ